MDLGCPIIKRMVIIMWIRVCPTEKRTLIEKMVERDAFLTKPKHEYHLSKWGERIYMPNREKKGDYYVKTRLSKSADEHYF